MGSIEQMSRKMNFEPLFIVGAPRSGTTWLQLMLAQSPLIATANETHLFDSYFQSLFKAWDAYQERNRAIGLHHIIDEKDYFDLIRDFSGEILDRIGATKKTAHLVLEKTPAHGRHWHNILKVMPEAAFIHIVRDPRDVVASLRSAAHGWGKHWADSGIVTNSKLWARDVSVAAEIRSKTERYLMVKYEDLRVDTATELQRIFDHLGVNTTRGQCENYVDRYKLEDVITEKNLGEVPWKLAAEPQGFFGKGANRRWQDKLSPLDVRLIEYICSDSMDHFGYQRAYRRPIFLVRPFLHSLVLGVEWRLRRISGTI